MKILFTTGGTGGHFYPIIAVAEEINQQIKDGKLLPAKLYFMSDSPYNQQVLSDNNIEFVPTSAGKMRRYFSILNIFDLIKTAIGVVSALIKVFSIFPDVVFSKGAYASFPVVLAAKILGIPVIIHESDSVPGRANLWAGKSAIRVAVSYIEAAKFFKTEKTAVTGNPIRKSILHATENGAFDYLNLDPNIPTILIIGGSQGARLINDVIIEALPALVEKYQIVHQTGKNNFAEVTNTAKLVLEKNNFANRYHPFEYLNDLSLSMSAGVAKLVISRAGSSIFEIANWNLPSIIIPITDSNGDHQRQNAYNYGRTGATTVIEENNLSSTVLKMEIDRILDDQAQQDKMILAAKGFAKPDASEKVAQEIINIALTHEK